MSRIRVLYYSSYGHVGLMARAQAEGAARVAGVAVTVKRVPELTPRGIAKASEFVLDQSAPIAQPDELERYDAIIFSTPTRFGNMAAQMRNFLNQTGPLWARNALVRKIGSIFCRTASQDGGQETTFTSFHTTLFHQGMIVVGLPYSCKELTTLAKSPAARPKARAASRERDRNSERQRIWNSRSAAFHENTWQKITAQFANGARVDS